MNDDTTDEYDGTEARSVSFCILVVELAGALVRLLLMLKRFSYLASLFLQFWTKSNEPDEEISLRINKNRL